MEKKIEAPSRNMPRVGASDLRLSMPSGVGERGHLQMCALLDMLDTWAHFYHVFSRKGYILNESWKSVFP